VGEVVVWVMKVGMECEAWATEARVWSAPNKTNQKEKRK
jgi:hypothetical protein